MSRYRATRTVVFLMSVLLCFPFMATPLVYESFPARDWIQAAATPDPCPPRRGWGQNLSLCSDLSHCSQALNPLHHSGSSWQFLYVAFLDSLSISPKISFHNIAMGLIIIFHHYLFFSFSVAPTTSGSSWARDQIQAKAVTCATGLAMPDPYPLCQARD